MTTPRSGEPTRAHEARDASRRAEASAASEAARGRRWGSRGSRRRRHPGETGMTLIEVVIVLVIAVLLMGGVVFASGAIQRSRLKSGASRVAAAMRVGFQRASSTGKRVRLVIDFDNNTLWLEDSSDAMLVKENDVLGTGGADPATAAERAAQEEAARINAGPLAPRASFMAVPGPAGEPQPLQTGIVFKAVDAQHEKEPRTAGRGYVYFFASEAERASVQVKIAGSDDDHDVFSVVVAPLTGKATVMDGTVNVPHPRDDNQETSEVEDDGH